MRLAVERANGSETFGYFLGFSRSWKMRFKFLPSGGKKQVDLGGGGGEMTAIVEKIKEQLPRGCGEGKEPGAAMLSAAQRRSGQSQAKGQ